MPEALKDFVDQQVENGTYSSSSEYVRELIRKDQQRQQVRGLLLAGAQSAAGLPATADYFERLRARVKQASKSRGAR